MSSMYVFTPKCGCRPIFYRNKTKQHLQTQTYFQLLGLEEKNFTRCLQFRRNSNLQLSIFFVRQDQGQAKERYR